MIKISQLIVLLPMVAAWVIFMNWKTPDLKKQIKMEARFESKQADREFARVVFK